VAAASGCDDEVRARFEQGDVHVDDFKSDQELIEAAKRGDDGAFATLYHRHKQWVVRLAWRFAGNREDALETLQETFAYLLKKLPHLRLSARMTTFLYPVVKHTAQAAARKSRRYACAESEPGRVAQELPDRSANAVSPDEARRRELAAALSNLPDEQREALLMRYVDDMSIDEIAKSLAIPPGTVKSRLHNALKALRQDKRARDYFDR
jgi:RNA polymerase sigma-70 factor (ECF subfamily)